jgi:septum formation protein
MTQSRADDAVVAIAAAVEASGALLERGTCLAAATSSSDAGRDVVTACGLWPAQGVLACVVAVEAATVEFHELDRDTVRGYVATGEPLDKAGSYGIQGRGSELVKELRGEFHCVMGLPSGLTRTMLNAAAKALL